MREQEDTQEQPQEDDLALEKALFNTDDDEFSLFRAAALLPRIEGRGVDLVALDLAVAGLAERVKARLHDAGGKDAKWPAPLSALVEVLFRELGYQGDAEEYDAPKNSFVDEVIERRRGLPIALSVLTCEVAHRAGIEAFGIAFPGHFLVGVKDGAAPGVELVVLDPFHRGRLLSQKHLEQQLHQLTGKRVELSAEHLSPAAPDAILVRMINNLRGSYLRRQEPQLLARALSRLLILRPGDAAALVERAEARRQILETDGAVDDAKAAIDASPNAAIAARARAVLKALEDDAKYSN